MLAGGQPGYDHCFCRVPKGGVHATTGLLPFDVIAVLKDPSSGRTMTVSTDQPGVQVRGAEVWRWLDARCPAAHTRDAGRPITS